MTRYRNPSIKDVGLELFLNSSKEKHNNMGYTEFKSLLDAKVNLTNLARAFNVSRPTIIKWIDIFKEEQGVVTTK